MSDKKSDYNRCINCGKYIETEVRDKSLFCCPECLEQYSCCNICSQYYNTEKTHADSLKCKLVFSLNHKKKPYIKHSMFRIFILGNPLFNTEMMSDILSHVFKLPLFISEKFRIENQLNISYIKKHIKQRIEAEKLQNCFIFLCDSYDVDFIPELLNELSFDKIIIIDTNEEKENSSLNLKICNNCGNINSFSEPMEHGEESVCTICGNINYNTSENNTIIANKLKNYQICKDFIDSTTAYKHINFTTITETAREIVRYFAYT